jgi:phosphatidylethanolamine-binding protein (PEBP) family uncharacterized protein
MIPPQYTCNGLNINPELMIEELPANTKVFIIVDDSDAPSGCHCHWLVWDILPETIIQEDSVPGIQGRNSMGANKYIGPALQAGYINIILKSMLWTIIHCPSTNEKN